MSDGPRLVWSRPTWEERRDARNKELRDKRHREMERQWKDQIERNRIDYQDKVDWERRKKEWQRQQREGRHD